MHHETKPSSRSTDRGDTGDRLAAANIERLTNQHRLVTLAATVADGQEWMLAGALSPARWISDQLGVDVGTAREWIRVGRALADLPIVDQAFADGKLSYSKVRVLTRVATPETQAHLCAGAPDLSATALGSHYRDEQQRRQHPLADHGL